MESSKRDLLITYSPEISNGEPIFFWSNCLPVKAVNFEAAGHSFHAAALKSLGLYEDEDADTDDQNEAPSDRGHAYTPSYDSYRSKSKKKSASGSKQQQDHYALLGLGHLRFLATEEQIRKSYRETALKHHPDKQAAILLAEETEDAKQAKKDEIETRFKSIQEAYEILMDPTKRRIYDSTDEFDDEVPTDCAPQDFFKVFGLALMRNGRWSVSQPVPSLGDESSSLDEVDAFYNFWYSFKSWREFPHADDFDLEQADSRDHKRWMERQNAKLQEKTKKEEYARIRTLVDNAYKRDPRIIRRKEEEKAEKQRRKAAKFLVKKSVEEAAARAAEEEQRRKEEEEKRLAEEALMQKKMKEMEKKLLRKERSRFRTLSLGLSEDEVEKACTSLKREQLRHLCDDMERSEGDERGRYLRDALKDGDSYGSKEEVKNDPGGAMPNGKAENPLSSYQKKERPWGKEEIEMLRKGMQKYPKGTSRRWEVISEYIGTERSVEEILKATKTVLLRKPDDSKAFDSFLEKRKPTQAIESPLTTRVESEGPTAAAAASESTAMKAASSEIPNGVPEVDAWSGIQERALIQALKTFTKDVSQRWERVATAVPGKTVNQCKKKFTLMKEHFRNKKNAD